MTTPAASPQSNHHHHQNNNHNYRSISSMNHSKSLMRMNSGSNLKSMKRWSASQDIRFSSIVDPNVKYVICSKKNHRNDLKFFSYFDIINLTLTEQTKQHKHSNYFSKN